MAAVGTAAVVVAAVAAAAAALMGVARAAMAAPRALQHSRSRSRLLPRQTPRLLLLMPTGAGLQCEWLGQQAVRIQGAAADRAGSMTSSF